MTAYVPFIRLIERTNDDGQRVLTGWLGDAKIIGHRGRQREDDTATWILLLVTPDHRANESRRRAWAKRQADNKLDDD